MKPIYKTLFCGDRNWTAKGPIVREILRLKKMCSKQGFELVIIEGEAPGADQLSRVHGELNNVHVCRVKALWDTRHNGAGPQRNTVMLQLEPHEVVAFHPDLKKSKGTRDLLTQAQSMGIPNKLVKK